MRGSVHQESASGFRNFFYDFTTGARVRSQSPHSNVAKGATLEWALSRDIDEIRLSWRYLVHICTGETALVAGCKKNLSERIAKEPEA